MAGRKWYLKRKMAAFPVAAFLTALLSVLASGPRLLRWGEALPAGGARPFSALSLRPEAVREWQVYRLVTYIFVYEDLISLVCGAVIIWYFAGSFEKNVGSVKHCFLTIAFAVLSAVVYLVLRAAVSEWFKVADAEGFTPVAFAMLSASIVRSQMKRTLFFGINLRVTLVPWLLLGAAWLIPSASLLGNLCGLLIGNIYGYGYCFGLDLPESTASRLDQKFPFQLLRRIPGLKYIPGSLAERRACLSRKLNPAPGSYPTQSYPSSPPLAFPVLQMQHTNPQAPGLWPQHPPGDPHVTAPSQTFADRGEPCLLNHFHTPLGRSSSQHLNGPHLWVPSRTDHSEASVPSVPGFPASEAALVPAELCQVHEN
ncbi:rhomboid domain-containing protein 2 [Tiliqua scincoides]|uniref:rhomboid domain-containing protein 2 n=1 Tax=Tiliqua scincoides TaxID=71010 RepID=UPI003462D581